MSGQRYIPSSEPRQRDRSPPRHPDRYPSDSFAGGFPIRNGDYGSRPNVSGESSASALGRGVPRGPKALVDVRRGSGIIAPLAPRGRGYLSRGAYRGDFRGQDQLRNHRDSPPRVDERDRSWRDREVDIRERRPSSQARHGQGDFRDFRDPSQRDLDAGRGRRESRDGLFAGDSHLVDRRISNVGTFGRGGFNRGRARGDWNFRGRGRGSVNDQRGVNRARTRSPDDYRWGKKSFAEEQDFELRNERYIERREDQKAVERDDREREAERWKREQYPCGNDSRRPSAPSTRPSTPHPFPPPTTQSYSAGRTGADKNRDGLPPNQLAGTNTPTDRGKDVRRENLKSDFFQSRTELSRDPYISGTSSPLQAPPQVPAFGSVSFETPPPIDTRWNVWKAPDLKPFQNTGPAAGLLNAVKTATTNLAPDTSVAPPKAPRADREHQQTAGANLKEFEPSRSRESKANGLTALLRPFNLADLKSSVPTGKTPEDLTRHQSQAIKSPQSRPIHTSSLPLGPRIPTRLESLNLYQTTSKVLPPRSVVSTPVSPILSAPLGPRATTVFVSPQSLRANIPTGPKAERGPLLIQQTRAPFLPTPATSLQWSRPGLLAQPGRSGAVVPAKRDLRGQEKGHASPSEHSSLGHDSAKRLDRLSFHMGSSLDSAGGVDGVEARSHVPNSGVRAVAGRKSPQATNPVSGNIGDTVQIDKSLPRSTSATVGVGLAEEDDPMDLDEGDFADNEAKFEKEKALLESKLIDLGSRYLRGTSPLQHLALLFRISVEDLPMQEEKEVTSPEAPPPEEAPTLKAEETEDTIMVDPRTPPRTSPSPIRSPELRSLPFLLHEPLTPISDLDVFQENSSTHESSKGFLKIEIIRRFQSWFSKDNELRKEYVDRYREWKKHVAQLDLQLQAEDGDRDRTSVETASQVSFPEMSQTILTAMGEGRRQRGTEYEYEQMLKLSEESARAEQARREKALKMPDLDKEAIIPELLSDSEMRNGMFEDTAGLRRPEYAIAFYELEPPKDNFTEQEHQTLVQNFKEYPKKWGKLAQGLQGRTYQECINHYYATKWNQEYKPPKSKNRLKGVKGKPRAGTSRANALISNLGGPRPDMDEGDDFAVPVIAVTDSGRPRRAAAPTWGDKLADEQTISVVTPARKATRSGLHHEASVEKAIRRPRAQTKEKAQRKPRNQPSMRVPSISPEKFNHDLPHQAMAVSPELRAPEIEVPNRPAAIQSGYGQSSTSQVDSQKTYGSDQTNHPLPDRDALDGLRMQNSQQSQRVTTTSSYWSRQENDEFPALLEHFGQDWSGIANHMGTKTMTMVKNHYFRQLSYPPATTTLTPRRRNEPGQPMIPRTLAPNTDVMEAEDGTPPTETNGSDDPAKSRLHASPPLPGYLQTVVHGAASSRHAPIATITAPKKHVLSRGYENAQQVRDTLGGFTRDTYPESQSSGQHERPSNPSMVANQPSYMKGSEYANKFQIQRRSAAVDEAWRAVGRQDLLQASVQSYEPVGPTFGAYYEPPKQQGTQMLSSSHLRDHPLQAGIVNTTQQDSQFETQLPQSNAQRLTDPLHQILPNSISTSTISTTRPSQMPPLAGAETQIFSQPQQSANQQPVPLRQEQRKTSNLAAILNAEPDEPKPSRSYMSQVAIVQTKRSPQASFQDAGRANQEHTQSERRDALGNLSIRNTHQESLHAQPLGNSVQSMSFSYPTVREPQSQLTSRPDWASAVAYPHGPSAVKAEVPRPFDRPTDSILLFNRGNSLQTLQASHNPAPPPGLEFHHLNRDTPLPQHQPLQVHQQSQIPVQTLQSNPYRVPAAPGPQLRTVQQNQQMYNHNSAQGLTEHRRRISENKSLARPLFTEQDYRARQDTHRRDGVSALEQLRMRPEPIQPFHEQYQQRQQHEQQQQHLDEQTSYVAQPHQRQQSQHNYGYDGIRDEERHMSRPPDFLDYRRALGSSLMARPSSTPANSVTSLSQGHKQVHPPTEIQSKGLQPHLNVDHARQLQQLTPREGQITEQNRWMPDQARAEMSRYEESGNPPVPEQRFRYHGPIPRESYEDTNKGRKARRKRNETSVEAR